MKDNAPRVPGGKPERPAMDRHRIAGAPARHRGALPVKTEASGSRVAGNKTKGIR